MTIHPEHPFATPRSERDQVRRMRSRLVAPVTVWTATRPSGRRVGLTVSSVLVALGEPGEVIGLIDPDSDLADALAEQPRWVVNLLGWEHRQLSDAMAGLAPAPGGPFRLHEWTDSDWGPVLADGPGWLGAELAGSPEKAGRSLLVRGTIGHAQVGGVDPLIYLKGRYRRL